MADIEDLVAKLDTRAPLDRSPRKNWVENAGGLPMFIRRIANHLHAEKGMTIGHAIAVAVNVCKKMCSEGDVNFPGVQQVNAGSRAEACAAVTEWEAKKASSHVSKIRVAKGEKVEPTDKEYVQILHSLGALDYVEKRNYNLIQPRDKKGKWKKTKVFKREEEVELRGQISKVDEEKQMVFGWAQVVKRTDGSIVYDRQGDFIDDVSHLENAAYDFVVNSRTGGEMHVRKGVSTMIESFVSTPEKLEAMGLPSDALPQGWWCGWKVTDQEVWKGIREGKYPMMSVHGWGIREQVDE